MCHSFRFVHIWQRRRIFSELSIYECPFLIYSYVLVHHGYGFDGNGGICLTQLTINRG